MLRGENFFFVWWTHVRRRGFSIIHYLSFDNNRSPGSSRRVLTTFTLWESRVTHKHLKSPQALCCDSLVPRQLKPGRSAHVTMPTTLSQSHEASRATVAFQPSRVKSIALLQKHPRGPNFTRFISVCPYWYAHHLRPPFNIQNEKRKDKEVTARIERILKLRNQSMKGVDMGARTIYNFTLSAGDEHLSLRQSGTEGRSSRARLLSHDRSTSMGLSVTSIS